MNIKHLKLLKNMLSVIGFLSIFFVAIACGEPKEISTKTHIILMVVSVACLAGGMLGAQALENEIEYRERMAKKKCYLTSAKNVGRI